MVALAVHNIFFLDIFGSITLDNLEDPRLHLDEYFQKYEKQETTIWDMYFWYLKLINAHGKEFDINFAECTVYLLGETMDFSVESIDVPEQE